MVILLIKVGFVGIWEILEMETFGKVEALFVKVTQVQDPERSFKCVKVCLSGRCMLRITRHGFAHWSWDI